ncbi:reverse transcriptase domain-containing protein [Tanacetum coccineum]
MNDQQTLRRCKPLWKEGGELETPMHQYLKKGIVPSDKNEARSLRAKIGQYVIESGILFKKGYLVPMLRCVGPLQANYVIREIHMGSCGMHIGPRAVVRKAMRQGYYWPTMHADAKEVVDKCDSCQFPILRFQDYPKTTHDIHHGSLALFINGDGHPGTIDTKPSRIQALPRIIVTDNGAQLVNEPFKGWCTRFKIQQINTSVAHPQANGLVERANRSLMEGIKTRLGRERAGWVDELPNVLWKEEKQLPYERPSTKQRWNSTITRGSAQLVLGRESLCIEGMRQAGWRMKESWDLEIGKAHIESTEAFENGLTSCKQ